MQSVLAKMSTGGEKIRYEGRIGRMREVDLSYGAFASYGSVETKYNLRQMRSLIF